LSRFGTLDPAIVGLKLIDRQKLSDSLGFPSRIFCAEKPAAAGWRKPFAQINQTLTVCRDALANADGVNHVLLAFQSVIYRRGRKINVCIRGEA
jgi:hypothetical protein